jgi:type II secretory pathway pseudopilin PulG
MSDASGKLPPTLRRRQRDPRRPRAGLSLLEVLVATVILAGSMVVLMELAAIGRRQVSRIERSSTAQRLCRTKIDEVAAGIVQAQDVDDREFDAEPDWRYSIQTEATATPGLTSVKVTVWHDAGQSGIGAGKSGGAAASGKAAASRKTTSQGNAAASGGGGAGIFGAADADATRGPDATRGSSGSSTSRGAGGSESSDCKFTLVRWLQKTSADGSDASTLPGGRRLPPGFRGGRKR